MSSTIDTTSAISNEISVKQIPEPILSDEISILDLIDVAVRHRRVIGKVLLAVSVVMTIVVLLLPNYYTGESIILTPTKRPSMSDALNGNFGNALGALGAADSLGLKDPNDVYIAMLKSETIGNRLAKRFNLAEYYDEKKNVDMLDDLSRDTNISSGHDGTITISYLHKDPKLAADISNAYIEELRKLTQEVAVDESKQRRDFFSAQLDKEKELLTASENALRKSQETSGMLDLDKQATAIVTAIATLEGQIMGQEILIQGLRQFGTSRNPDVMLAEQQLAKMKEELASLQRKNAGNGDLMVGTGKLPATGLEYLRKVRDVRYNEAVLEVLSKQYVAAMIDSAMSGDVIQVVQQATPRDKKSKPKRSLLLLAAVFVAGLLTYMGCFSLELWRRLEADPVDGPRVQRMSAQVDSSWKWMVSRVKRLRGGKLRSN